MKRNTFLRSSFSRESHSVRFFARAPQNSSAVGSRGVISSSSCRSVIIRASSHATNSVSFPRHPFSRCYSNAVQTNADVQEIKELVSPVFYERRIKDLYATAQKNIEEQQWTKAEDRLFAVLDTSEQLRKTLTELEKEPSQNEFLKDYFLGRVNVMLAFSQHNQGKRDYAEEHYSTGIKFLKSALGADHVEVAYALVNLAEVYSLLSRLDDAEATQREAIPLLEKHLGKEHEIVGGAWANLGGFLCAQGKFTEAIPVNEQAADILDKTLGQNNEFTLSALSNCIKMYEELGNKEAIEKLKQRYGERHKEFIEMHRKNEDYSQEEVDKMAKQWNEEAAKKVLDPEGMYKPRELHKEQLKAFVQNWTSYTGERLRPEQVAMLVQELEGLDEKTLQEVVNEKPELFAKLAEELKTEAPTEDVSWKEAHPHFFGGEFQEQSLQEETTEEGKDFAYDEEESKEEKPKRGHWRRMAASRRRKVKTEEGKMARRVGFLDDEDLAGGKHGEEAEQVADKIMQKKLSPELLRMMEKEEELTQRQFIREGEAMEKEAKEKTKQK